MWTLLPQITHVQVLQNTEYSIRDKKISISKIVRYEWDSCIFSSHPTNSLRSRLPDDKAISVLRCHRNFILRFIRGRETHRKWEVGGHALAFRHHMNSVADTIWSSILPFMMFINIIPLLKSDLSRICQVESFIHFQNEGVRIYRSYFLNILWLSSA
jgi:hypothetical protein